MVIERMDVRTLTQEYGDWPPLLEAYEQAVGIMRSFDPPDGHRPDNPLGWRFQAAIHGIADASGDPDKSNEYWCYCPHGSWFFLPWHRMYLAAFERIVQHVLGDSRFALPYWHAIDPEDPGRGALPPAFRDTNRPGNNLYTDQRSRIVNAGLPFFGKVDPTRPNFLYETCRNELMAALDTTPFATEEGGPDSFGSGKEDKPSFSEHEEEGRCEAIPHGYPHVLVGNDFDANFNVLRQGWMASPYTAAQDPIFWLHHANIDRLWEAWRSVDPATHLNPLDDDKWLDTEFSFPAAHPKGSKVTWSIRQVLDTRSLNYVYDSLAPAELVRPAQPDAEVPREAIAVGFRRSEAAMPGSEPAKVIAAQANVRMSSAEPVTVELAGLEAETMGTVGPRSRSATAQAAGSVRFYVRIEGVHSDKPAPGYSIYLNVPPGEDPRDHPELRACSVSTFRLVQASRSDELHNGSGVSTSCDITALCTRLMTEGRWNNNQITVSIVPDAPAPLQDEEDEEDEVERIVPDVWARRIAFLISRDDND